MYQTFRGYNWPQKCVVPSKTYPMKLKFFFVTLCLGVGTLMAQTNKSKLLNTTWKVDLGKNSTYEFTCTMNDIYITDDDQMIVVPQCYQWDGYFKIISIIDDKMVLQEYDYTHRDLKPTNKFYHLKKTNLSLEDYNNLIYMEKFNYLRING